MQSIIPAITTVIGKCVGVYSRKMSAQRTFYSIVLNHGGIKDSAMNRLAKLCDCVTHQNLLSKLNAIADRYDLELIQWRKQCEEYGIVFDNVDLLVRPRRETQSTANTMYHMVQAMAVKERVTTTGTGLDTTSPATTIDTIQPENVIPSNDDYRSIRSLMINQVLKIWAEMPCMTSLKLPILSEQHEYSDVMKKRSEMVRA